MKPASMIAVPAVVLAVVLGGCGGRLPTTHYYVLAAPDLPSTNPRGEGMSIGIRTFRVDPPYDQDRIVYRVGQDSPEVGFYAYHRWAAPLERMLPRVAATSFSDLSGVSSIEPAEAGRDYDAQIGGRILAFEEIDTGEGQQVRVQLHLYLLVGNEEVWAATVTGDDALHATEVGQIVQHMRAALATALEAARPDLQSALNRHRN